jgi:pyruvate/2-oxoglutarate dehydrogenase complex dihydrolipoamide acyltransferase (E2) component
VSSSPTETSTDTVEVTMPQMGVSVAEGTVVEWRKQPGDRVRDGETVCEVSSDKIDTEVPSPCAGRLVSIAVDVGTTVPVGTVLALLSTDEEPGEPQAVEDVEEAGAHGPPPGRAQRSATGTGEASAALSTPGSAGELAARAGEATDAGGGRDGEGRRPRRRYSPVVLRMAEEHGIDLEQVPGTGRHGRVRKQDVLGYLERNGEREGAPAQEPPLHSESPYRPEPEPEPGPAPVAEPAAAPEPTPAIPAAGGPLSRMRRSIGEHMLRSLHTAAHCTTIVEADMSRVEAARRRADLTYLPLVARCVIAALREHPALNATLEGDALTRHADVNLGIAVSLGEDGLIVPVIPRAQELSAEGLGARIKDLAGRARARGLSADEVRGGTFTITNPGAFGAVAATPIINLPQVAILDLEAVVKRPVVVTDDLGRDSIAIRPMTNLCMSWDHRALDGALAARFLSTLRREIEAYDGG